MESPPIPSVKTKPLYDQDGKFYMLLRVEPVVKDRPYILKGKGACYIRVGNGSLPASRDAILSLCKLTIDRTESVGILGSVAKMVREQLAYVNKQANAILVQQNSLFFIPEIDL